MSTFFAAFGVFSCLTLVGSAVLLGYLFVRDELKHKPSNPDDPEYTSDLDPGVRRGSHGGEE